MDRDSILLFCWRNIYRYTPLVLSLVKYFGDMLRSRRTRCLRPSKLSACFRHAGLHAYGLDIESASIDGITTQFELKPQLTRQAPFSHAGSSLDDHDSPAQAPNALSQ